FRRKLGVKVDVRLPRPIEEFEIAQQGNLRPHILDVEDFAPSVVTDDNVGNVPVTIEPPADVRYRQTVRDAVTQLAQIGMRIGMARHRAVFDFADALYFSCARLGDETHLMTTVRQISRNVDILA